MTKNAPLIPADWVIQSPGELEALMARLHELLEAGVLVQIGETAGGIGFSDIRAVPKSGPWPDVIHAEFRDADGVKYRLSVDTYHGHGGSWRSILASAARPLDHVVTPLGRTGLRYAEGDRSMFIDSEMLARPNGIAVYRASIVRWDPPHESDAMSEGDRARILASTVEALQLQGLDVDVI